MNFHRMEERFYFNLRNEEALIVVLKIWNVAPGVQTRSTVQKEDEDAVVDNDKKLKVHPLLLQA